MHTHQQTVVHDLKTLKNLNSKLKKKSLNSEKKSKRGKCNQLIKMEYLMYIKESCSLLVSSLHWQIYLNRWRHGNFLNTFSIRGFHPEPIKLGPPLQDTVLLTNAGLKLVDFISDCTVAKSTAWQITPNTVYPTISIDGFQKSGKRLGFEHDAVRMKSKKVQVL